MIGSGMFGLRTNVRAELAAETWRDGFFGRRYLLCGDNPITRLHIAADDLRETIVVQPGDHRYWNRLPVAQNPDLRLAGLTGGRQTVGYVPQCLVWHTDHVDALIDDDAAGGRHARHQRQV